MMRILIVFERTATARNTCCGLISSIVSVINSTLNKEGLSMASFVNLSPLLWFLLNPYQRKGLKIHSDVVDQ